MPEYNQAFGQSNKAASVSMIAPAAGAKFEAGATVTLKADAKDSDGSVKSVAFYVGNTLVGSATAAPYQVNASGLEPGVYSAVAVVTDNSGLSQMSSFVTFTVEGTAASSSSEAESSSSETPELSSSESPPSSSSNTVTPESSSSKSDAVPQVVNFATEAETAYYRMFDMRGRPLFAGDKKPAKMPAARVIVVEFTKGGTVKRAAMVSPSAKTA